jgi:hypothetical protein
LSIYKSVCDIRIIPETEQTVIAKGIIVGSGSRKGDAENRRGNRRRQGEVEKENLGK